MSIDIQCPESPAFNDVSRIVLFDGGNREKLILVDTHGRFKKSQQHVPALKKSVRINADEEPREVLVVNSEVLVCHFGSIFAKKFEELIYISMRKMFRAGTRNQLK